MPSRHTNYFPESGRGLGHVTPTILGSTVGYPSDSLASCYFRECNHQSQQQTASSVCVNRYAVKARPPSTNLEGRGYGHGQPSSEPSITVAQQIIRLFHVKYSYATNPSQNQRGRQTATAVRFVVWRKQHHSLLSRRKIDCNGIQTPNTVQHYTRSTCSEIAPRVWEKPSPSDL